MIIYLDEEGAYLSWIRHHRQGFVVDWLRQPSRQRPSIHRATCPKIRVAKSKKTHWTTGRHQKACSLELEKLVAWAENESGLQPEYCCECTPQDESAPAARRDEHLTKLSREILDHVVEVAVIHLDHKDSQYELTVGDLAAAVDKTAGQISDALMRLMRMDLLRLAGDIQQRSAPNQQQLVMPTRNALRMLPAFEKLTDCEIDDELNLLESR